MKLFKKPELSGEYCEHCSRPTTIKKSGGRKYNTKTGQLISETYVIQCPLYSRYSTHSFKTIEKKSGESE